jgi:small subunit ribosomal protein S16
MSVKIRLQRRGTTNTPFYKIVVADSRMRRDGRTIEEIGFYDPLKQPAVVKVNRSRAFKWMRDGAILSDTVERIFSKVGILADWQKVRKGEMVAEEGAPEMKIFPQRRAQRPSKKARAKAGQKEGDPA